MKNKRRWLVRWNIAVLGGLVLLSVMGCAQQQWSKPGLNQSEFDKDAARCRREAASATYLDPFVHDLGIGQDFDRSVAQQKRFEQCMAAKGYRLEGRAPANKE